MGSEMPFEQRIVAFSVVEGIFFSDSFCAIFGKKKFYTSFDKKVYRKKVGGKRMYLCTEK
jgi:hypothetical protein